MSNQVLDFPSPSATTTKEEFAVTRHCEERSDEAIDAAAGALSGWLTISRRWIASLGSQ